MPRFYLDAPLRAGSSILLAEDSAHHAVHVLRVRTGDDVTLFNGRGGEFAARIASIERLKVLCDVLQHRDIERESPLRIVLVQGVSSGERMDFTVRKAVELGVAEIHPVLAAASVARPKGERAAARHAALAESCHLRLRAMRPQPHSARAADDRRGAITVAGWSRRSCSRRRPSCASRRRASQATRTFTIAAGPEAGFNAEKSAAFLDAGFVPARLGPRVLRTETAGLAALAALNALRGDF